MLDLPKAAGRADPLRDNKLATVPSAKGKMQDSGIQNVIGVNSHNSLLTDLQISEKQKSEQSDRNTERRRTERKTKA